MQEKFKKCPRNNKQPFQTTFSIKSAKKNLVFHGFRSSQQTFESNISYKCRVIFSMASLWHIFTSNPQRLHISKLHKLQCNGEMQFRISARDNTWDQSFIVCHIFERVQDGSYKQEKALGKIWPTKNIMKFPCFACLSPFQTSLKLFIDLARLCRGVNIQKELRNVQTDKEIKPETP